MDPITCRKIEWRGPFSWPDYEKENGLPALPLEKGVYLQAFEYSGGYLIYAAGLTRRYFHTRFKEHTRSYLNGEYNILDVPSATSGIRKEHWHGWEYARNNRDEFEELRSALTPKINYQLCNFRIFVANLGAEPRIHERIESSIMNVLYTQLPPVAELPDRGMFLSKRKPTEQAIILENSCHSILWGLPRHLEI
ncbi:hypothetical protein VIN01S_22670 [Vibrio inusitatus NBRC 102082]|uniref:GIY-YIG domain-containing protein n=1 Tax=Vibrio inusitatus NBRC 102082 TaxID=1219070 RepID=A0A4Y3HWA5_9VIBR|nr:hypothetical protein [Vibrio inusitatus]GEA51463.1 hypothetical protein VIN01S_22670 [Vibrio inusitatus NBRC 102082]